MVYKDCDIGSAKPNKNVLEKYPHHLIDIVSPNEVFNVSDFCKYSKKIIEIAHSKNKLPIFVGGSMMYFKSLYSGLYDLPERDQEFRESLKKLQSNGNDFFLYNKLNQIDPDYATKIHKNDEVRIIRALEIYEKTGRKMSEIFSESTKNPPLIQPDSFIGFSIKFFTFPFSSKSNAPNLARGFTAVNVASFLFFL